MLRQLDIFADFTPEHNRHTGNQQILEENRKHFEGQTKKVLDHLLKGEKVTGLKMMELHKIQDVRARIYAIKKAGYDVAEEKVEGGKGSKAWFIKEFLLSKMDIAA